MPGIDLESLCMLDRHPTTIYMPNPLRNSVTYLTFSLSNSVSSILYLDCNIFQNPVLWMCMMLCLITYFKMGTYCTMLESHMLLCKLG